MPETQTLTDGTTRTWYSTKETAQLIREALKAAFLGVKFSIRTKYGSCYSATNVEWTDGPTEQQVGYVTSQYTSTGFDGMTDSTTHHEQTFRGARVKFSGWVNVHRVISDRLTELAKRQLLAKGYEQPTDHDIWRRVSRLLPNGLYVELKPEGRA